MEAATQTSPPTSSDVNVGRVEEITGVVLEAVFEQDHLPEIYNALETEIPAAEDGGEPTKLVVRSSSIWATTASAAWPWTPPTA